MIKQDVTPLADYEILQKQIEKLPPNSPQAREIALQIESLISPNYGVVYYPSIPMALIRRLTEPRTV